MQSKSLSLIANEYLQDAILLGQAMIRIPSLSGKEKEMADLVQRTMRDWNYDEVTVDEVGNVIGLIKGTHSGKSIMFNCHLDTVDCGDSARWPYPPFAGEVAEGKLWGLGASDTKGAFACQIIAAAALKKEGLCPQGDIYVVGVVHEESSGFGSTFLAPKLSSDIVILGEASDNQLKIGHRGRMQFDVHFKGRSTHASAPSRGINPHYAAAKLLMLIQSLPMRTDPFFGISSAAPTLYVTDQTSSNVTPGEVVLSLDWRNIPGETEIDAQALLENLVKQCVEPEGEVEIELKMRDVLCFTGYQGRALAGEPSFSTPMDDEDVCKAKKILEDVFRHEVKIDICHFATDGGHFRKNGSKVLIFSPAEERLCHTTEDSVSIEKMREAILGNMALSIGLSSV